MVFGNKKDLYLECPMCDAEIPMSGDEKLGIEVQCPACETPLKLKKKKDDSLYFQEDF